MVYIRRGFSRVFQETAMSEDKRLVNSAII